MVNEDQARHCRQPQTLLQSSITSVWTIDREFGNFRIKFHRKFPEPSIHFFKTMETSHRTL